MAARTSGRVIDVVVADRRLSPIECSPVKSPRQIQQSDLGEIMVHTEQTAVVRQLWPLLTVQEIGRSVEFYCDRLGFAVVGRADSEEKMFWCRLERDGASLMLQQAEDEDGPATGRGPGVTF